MSAPINTRHRNQHFSGAFRTGRHRSECERKVSIAVSVLIGALMYIGIYIQKHECKDWGVLKGPKDEY